MCGFCTIDTDPIHKKKNVVDIYYFIKGKVSKNLTSKLRWDISTKFSMS